MSLINQLQKKIALFRAFKLIIFTHAVGLMVLNSEMH